MATTSIFSLTLIKQRIQMHSWINIIRFLNRFSGKLILLLLLLLQLEMVAQSIIVKSELEKSQILIGDQIKFSLEAEVHKSFQVVFPSFIDTIMGKIEIIEASAIDTTFLTADILKLNREFIITSFDSGVYIIPGQAFIFYGQDLVDTIYSEPSFLMVNTFQIDSIQGIFDIKPPIETPLILKETIPYLLWSIFGIALLIGIFLLWKILKNRPQVAIISKPPPNRPAHLIALDALDQLKKEKLWQQNRFKDYHSKLSDILRIYLDNRFHIDAMELTTDEIFQKLKFVDELKEEQKNQLKFMLELADLVKFAKAEPLANENERVFNLSYQLVLDTKISIDLREENNKPNPEKRKENV